MVKGFLSSFYCTFISENKNFHFISTLIRRFSGDKGSLRVKVRQDNIVRSAKSHGKKVLK